MAEPDYGDFVRLDGKPGNETIQNRDDAATVGVDQDADGDARDYSDGSTPDVPVGLVDDDTVTDPFSGNVMELSTGELYFVDNSDAPANPSAVNDSAAFWYLSWSCCCERSISC